MSRHICLLSFVAFALKTLSMADIIGNQKVACQGGVLAPSFRCASVGEFSQQRLANNLGGKSMTGHVKLATFLGIALIAYGAGAYAEPQVIGAPPEASNMKLVGSNDLQARSAYQPTIHHQGDRWIAYIGHHGGTDAVPDPVNPMTGKAEPNGTSIVDVTDPAHPKYLRHIPGQDG